MKLLGNFYLAKKDGDFFDTLKFSGLEIEMAERQGNEYTNFSQRVEITHVPPNEALGIEVGDVVYVHHKVIDNTISMNGETYLKVNERQIFFKGNIESPEMVNNNLLCEPFKEKLTFGHYTAEIEVPNTSEVLFSNTEGIEKGDIVLCLENSEQEIYINEKMYFVIQAYGNVLGGGVLAVNDKEYNEYIELERIENESENFRMKMAGVDNIKAYYTDRFNSSEGKISTRRVVDSNGRKFTKKENIIAKWVK
jgi:co-chaperonin GroES (HSP10)